MHLSAWATTALKTKILVVTKNIFMNKSTGPTTERLVVRQISLLLILLFPASAFAYVDPGSGSVIVTTVLGLFAAIGYTFRKYYYKVKRMITAKKTEEESQDSE